MGARINRLPLFDVEHGGFMMVFFYGALVGRTKRGHRGISPGIREGSGCRCLPFVNRPVSGSNSLRWIKRIPAVGRLRLWQKPSTNIPAQVPIEARNNRERRRRRLLAAVILGLIGLYFKIAELRIHTLTPGKVIIMSISTPHFSIVKEHSR